MFTGYSVSFHTLGCKLNFAETSTIARQLKEAGFRKVKFEEKADVVVINTCSVTENADRECRSLVRRVLALNPAAFVIVIGCYAQLKPEEIASIAGVDLVLGATEKFNVLNYLEDFSKQEQAEIHSCEISQADTFVHSHSIGDRTRAFLKVQDGCDYACSYCTIPMARGASRSDSIQNIVQRVFEIAAQGVKEIVLTGVNIGDFGISGILPGKRSENFLGLMQSLDQIEGIDRFRISSIEPNLLSHEMIEFVSMSNRFAPHFHIPLQSGSDKILGLMQRRYRKELYTEKVKHIKEKMPHACIGVDVIVGFPGESESDFLETYTYLNELDISYLHVFTYSERAGTLAVELKDTVAVSVRKRRNKMLRILSGKKLRSFYHQHLGKTYPVLFENEQKAGMISGFTPNYIRVQVPFDELLINQSKNIKLDLLDEDLNLSGSLSDPTGNPESFEILEH